ncbi:MAG: diphosphomevalonate decarboxylase [Microbacteriaceae bacterium]
MDTAAVGEATATARAHSNIALIKYWGKRDTALNIPAVGSISVTLDALYTDTQVSFVHGADHDEFLLNGQRRPAGRVGAILDLVRARAGIDAGARISSTNNFPTAAGLASSASGFAALTVAACAAAGLGLNRRELSILARRGSGSAARSIFGGYAQLFAGSGPDGLDAFAEPLLAADEWPLSVVVAITELGAKSTGSTAGMGSSAASSPFYPAWVQTGEADLAEMRAAIGARDLTSVGELTEHSCLKLHALMISTRPALLYWNAATVSVIHRVRRLRADGIPVYFTIDAGPQVKALCAPTDATAVAQALAGVPGVLQVRTSALGPDAALLT